MATPHRLRHHAGAVRVIEWHVTKSLVEEDDNDERGTQEAQRALADQMDRYSARATHSSAAGRSFIEPGSPWRNPFVESFGSRSATTCSCSRHSTPCSRRKRPLLENHLRPLAATQQSRLAAAGGLCALIYAELPGGQHAFDLFHSARNEAVVNGIEAFMEWHRRIAATLVLSTPGR
jgi:hypothetical protein